MPIDFDRDENGYLKEHKCIEKTMAYKKRFKKCWNCPKQITFSSKMVSQRGKKIPCEIIESTGRSNPTDTISMVADGMRIKEEKMKISPYVTQELMNSDIVLEVVIWG